MILNNSIEIFLLQIDIEGGNMFDPNLGYYIGRTSEEFFQNGVPKTETESKKVTVFMLKCSSLHWKQVVGNTNKLFKI